MKIVIEDFELAGVRYVKVYGGGHEFTERAYDESIKRSSKAKHFWLNMARNIATQKLIQAIYGA